MKNLSQLIQEKLKVNSTSKVNNYNYFPTDKISLKRLIKQLIEERGNKADLNDIDTSEITDMSYIFDGPNRSFNGDISKWNVSNVENMSYMFNTSLFNGDISNWDVSSVEDMGNMFSNSKFTGENGDISKWDVSKVENMNFMFYNSIYNGDISNWDVNSVKDMVRMFKDSPLEQNPPAWYKK